MADEKDNSPDPWAGIDGDDSEPVEGVSFSFDSLSGIGSGEGVGEPTAPTADAADGGLGESDDASFSGADLVEEWLEEPSPESPAHDEAPLAVFPPLSLSATDGDSIESQPVDDNLLAWNPSHVAEETPSTIESSAIQIGTGLSGIDSPDEMGSMDEWADTAVDSVVDASLAHGTEETDADHDNASDSHGFGVVGAVAEAEEFSFGSDAFGDDSQGIPVTTEFGEDAPDGFFGDTQEEALEGAVVAGVGAVTKSAGKKKPVSVQHSPQKKQSGIGQMIGVVFGGLMALPITYAILVWGFQKDPFKLTKMLPQEVAFVLPAKFQPGYKKPSALSGSGLPEASPLDALGVTDPTLEGEAPEEPSSQDDLPIEPGIDASAVEDDAALAALKSEDPKTTFGGTHDDVGRDTPVAAVQSPEPLDMSGLEAAVDKASVAYEELIAIDDPTDVEQKNKLLKGWYKNLARVAEEWVMLETVAADSGRPLEGVPQPVVVVYEKIAANASAREDLARLGSMWVKTKKRPLDGAVFTATFDATRKVGPYWSTSVTLPGTEPRGISLISRAEPAAAAGDEVVITGVLFDGDTVWATDCRRLEKSAPVEDLF